MRTASVHSRRNKGSRDSHRRMKCRPWSELYRMFRRKSDKRIVELNPEEFRLAKYAFLWFQNSWSRSAENHEITNDSRRESKPAAIINWGGWISFIILAQGNWNVYENAVNWCWRRAWPILFCFGLWSSKSRPCFPIFLQRMKPLRNTAAPWFDISLLCYGSWARRFVVSLCLWLWKTQKHPCFLRLCVKYFY